MDEVKHIKTECLNNPEEKLWIVTKDIEEVKNIFYHLKALSYKDVPDYQFVRNQLKSILAKNIEIPSNYLNQLVTQAYQNPQRVAGGAIPQIYLPTAQAVVASHHHQQAAPFAVFSNHYNTAHKQLAITTNSTAGGINAAPNGANQNNAAN